MEILNNINRNKWLTQKEILNQYIRFHDEKYILETLWLMTKLFGSKITKKRHGSVNFFNSDIFDKLINVRIYYSYRGIYYLDVNKNPEISRFILS
jgi:hypothetical protein